MPGLREAKYWLAASASASEIAWAIVIIVVARTPVRSPLLKAASWRMRYDTGSPARLDDSG